MTWDTQARALFHGARSAARSAMRYNRMAATTTDQAWFIHCKDEARKAREEAAFYLQHRRFMLDEADKYWDAAA